MKKSQVVNVMLLGVSNNGSNTTSYAWILTPQSFSMGGGSGVTECTIVYLLDTNVPGATFSADTMASLPPDADIHVADHVIVVTCSNDGLTSSQQYSYTLYANVPELEDPLVHDPEFTLQPPG
ncbi:MAG TPA: hypothetical protein VF824_12820 [Thermoanaerobaculia bacterium]|jgi:hypothetical protein